MVGISVRSHHTGKPKGKYHIDSPSFSHRNFSESFQLNDCFTRFHPCTAAHATHSGVWTGQADRRWGPVQLQLLMRMEWDVFLAGQSCYFGHSGVSTQAVASSHVLLWVFFLFKKSRPHENPPLWVFTLECTVCLFFLRHVLHLPIRTGVRFMGSKIVGLSYERKNRFNTLSQMRYTGWFFKSENCCSISARCQWIINTSRLVNHPESNLEGPTEKMLIPLFCISISNWWTHMPIYH